MDGPSSQVSCSPADERHAHTSVSWAESVHGICRLVDESYISLGCARTVEVLTSSRPSSELVLLQQFLYDAFSVLVGHPKAAAGYRREEYTSNSVGSF